MKYDILFKFQEKVTEFCTNNERANLLYPGLELERLQKHIERQTKREKERQIEREREREREREKE